MLPDEMESFVLTLIEDKNKLIKIEHVLTQHHQ